MMPGAGRLALGRRLDDAERTSVHAADRLDLSAAKIPPDLTLETLAASDNVR